MMTLSLAFSTAAFGADSHKHFHPKGNMPSKYTIEAQKHQREILPLADKEDFKEADKGFIAKPNYQQIRKEGVGIAMMISHPFQF